MKLKLLDRLPIPQKSLHMPLREMLFSVGGAFAAILILGMEVQLGMENTALTLLILASMGASTCLLFAIPHSPLAQPWPMFGGHIVSAVVGVACAQMIASPQIATAVAVALSIGVMYHLRCLHPPSAGTAMIAVIGGPAIHALGWGFIGVVVFNAGTILVLALAINNLIPERRYPLRHTHHPHHRTFEATTESPHLKLTEADFGWALDQMDGVIAVAEEDLVDLYEFAVEHAQKRDSESA